MHQPNRRKFVFTLGALPLALTACGGGSDTPIDSGGSGSGQVSFSAKAMVDNVADNIITTTYSNLNTEAAKLLAAVQALDAARTEANMDAAQAQWKATRVPWETSEAFLFGPVEALGIDPAIDSWPLNTPDLQDFLAANPNATAGQIEAASDDLRGFHAMEYLLFGDGVATNDKAAAALTAAEANYLVALVQAFKSRTQELASSWTTDFNGKGPYATTLKSPGAGKTYTGYLAVLEELFGGMGGIANEVANAKMAEPLGTSLATADTSKVESQYSWNSLTDFHNNIQSILNAYTGKLGFNWQTDTASASANGLYAFVAAHDSTLATRLLNEIIGSQKAIALVKGDGNNATTAITGTAKPFRTQILNDAGRALIATAMAATNQVQQTITSDVRPLFAKTTFS